MLLSNSFIFCPTILTFAFHLVCTYQLHYTYPTSTFALLLNINIGVRSKTVYTNVNTQVFSLIDFHVSIRAFDSILVISKKFFQKTVPVKPWSDVLQCKKYRRRAPQMDYFWDRLELRTGKSEDCLYLNIIKPGWAPPDEVSSPPKFWIIWKTHCFSFSLRLFPKIGFPNWLLRKSFSGDSFYDGTLNSLWLFFALLFCLRRFFCL